MYKQAHVPGTKEKINEHENNPKSMQTLSNSIAKDIVSKQ